ncbi:type II secretion system F family protein [Paenibacillus whitsoniae]|nr:type II secretion system F family protein [Paenibacillus whitsoniae]
MNIIISFCVFCLSLILFIPIQSFMVGRPFRRMLDNVLSKAGESRFSSATILHRATPFLNRMIRIFRIKGNSAKWEKTRDKIGILYASNEISIQHFIAIKIVVSAVVLIYMMLLNFAQPSGVLFMLTLLLAVISFYIPDQILNIKIKQRKWEIYREIPSILLSLAVTTDAGLSLNQALEEICVMKKGAFASELKKTLQQISVGIPQKEAFENLASRVRIDEITLFVSVLVQTLEKGASGITQVLREQANESWTKRKSVAKELAGKASIKLFLPMIGLVLPALMIFLIVPAVFSILRFFNY